MKRKTLLLGLCSLALALGSAGIIGGVYRASSQTAISAKAEEEAAYKTYDLSSSVPTTLTKGGADLNKDNSGRGYGASKQSFTLTTNDENFVNVCKVVVIASSNGTGGKAEVTVGDASLGSAQTITKTTNTEYIFENSTSLDGAIKLSITAGTSNKCSIWVKSIAVYLETTNVTALTLSPGDAATLSVGRSLTYTLGIEGTGLKGTEEAALSFATEVDGLTLSANSAKNGDTFTVTATKEGVTGELVATYGDITSNKVTITTEAAKTIKDLKTTGTLTKSSYVAGETFDPTGLSVVVVYDDDSELDVTDSVVWTPSTLTGDTTAVTGTYSENGVEKQVTVDVSVKTLTSITATSPTKTSYEEDDLLDLTGMVVTKHYSDGSEEETTDYTTSPAAGEKLLPTDTSLVVSVPGADSVSFSLTVNPYIVKQYKLVTSDPGDLTGDYLIVYKASADAAEGRAFSGVDVSKNFNAITFAADGTLGSSKEADANRVSIAKFGNGYSIKTNGGDNDGKYMYGTSSNGISWDDAAREVSITFKEDGTAKIVCSSSTFAYNKATNTERFRFYKSGSTQESVYLYKMIDTAAIAEASVWAQSFLDVTATPCSDGGIGDNSTKLSDDAVWGALSASYEALSASAKLEIKYASGSASSESKIEQAMARYDHIVTRYLSMNDFIGRRASDASKARGVLFSDSSSWGEPVACAALLLFALGAGACLILKKKENR